MEKEEIIEKLIEFFKQFYLDEIVSTISQKKKSLYVDFSLLERFDVDLADLFLEKPEEFLELAENALKELDLGFEFDVLRVRFYNLPEDKEIRIRNLRSEHIGKIVIVEGIVKRASEIRPEIAEAIFLCPVCGAKIPVVQSQRSLSQPLKCPYCGNKKGFQLVDQKLYDVRWIVIEEPFEIVSGERPSDIIVYLKEDLTDPKFQNMTDPGNRIKVVGILRQMPRKLRKSYSSRQLEIFIEANNIIPMETEWEEIEITEEDEKKILELAKNPNVYDMIVKSIAPSIYGLDEVKEAIALQLFGGVRKILKDGSKVRGDLHILLIGDPSCLVGDERVILGNGAIVKIESLGKYHLEKINVPVYLAKGYKRGIAKVFHKYEFQPIIEIITESGKSIKGTFNQPVLVKKKGKFGKNGVKQVWKRLDEIKIGDEVRVVNWIPCSIHKYLDTNWKVETRKNAKKIKIPSKLDERLGAILGYMLGDGYVSKYRVGCVFNYNELDLLPKLKKYFEEKFGIKPRFEYKKEKFGTNVEMVFNSIALAKVLKFLKEKRVPDLIFQSKNSVVASFLSWLYDADGSVIAGGRGKNGILFKSKNIELLRDIQILLLRFGIHSRIYGNNLMIRQANSIEKFAKNIGFNSKKKKEKLKKLLKLLKRYKHRRHNKMWERVVKIVYHPPETVYDIEVPKYKRFVANGIVVHNTAKSALMRVVAGLIPRGRYVSGKGVTYAGLTATVVRDEEFLGGWVLEAGALVLANGSLCAIDEFEKVDKQDQVALHEAMEQQSYHPSFEIMFADGSKHKIGDFVEDLMKKYKNRIVEGINCEILDVSNLNFKLLDYDGKKITPVKVLRVSRHKAPDYFIEITYSNGRKILVTPEHPVFIFKNGKIMTEEANKITKDLFVPGVRNLEIFSSDQILEGITKTGRKRINLPTKVAPSLSRFLGFFVSEGYSYKGSSYEVGISNSSPILSNRIISTIKETFSITPMDYTDRNRTLRIISKDVYLWMKQNFDELMKLSKFKRIPKVVFSLNKNLVKEFILAMFLGDGSSKKIPSYTSSSRELVEDLQDLLLKLQIFSRIHEFKQFGRTYWKLYVTGDSIPIFSKIFENKDIKRKKIRHHDILPTYVARKLRDILKIFRMYDGSLNKNIELNYGITKERFSKIYENIAKKIRSGIELIEKGNLKKLKKELNFSFNLISKISNLNESSIKYFFYGGYTERKRKMIEERILSSLRNFLETKLKELEALEQLENYRWLRIKKVRKIPNKGKYKTDWVYDVTVQTHKFISHGLILHNTISIAKASIVATLPARTAILAGGNPKLGRFDPYLPVRDQVDIPETLLSRFDLKFALRDIPNPDVDAKLADHILKTRYFGKDEEVKPPIPPDLLRKYIAYARSKVKPKMTEEAAQVLKEFYLSLREKSGGESPIAITPRQYDALMRLAEASARIQLREYVTKEDALRAIRLMSVSLRQFGFEPETGQIDIDKAEGAKFTATQRGKIRTILSIIEDLENVFGKEIPQDEIIRVAKEKGIDDVEEILRKMQREGYLYSPKPGVLSRL